MKAITFQDESLDEFCYRIYGHTNGTVEAILLNNRDIAKHGLFLPAGIEVDVPPAPPAPPKKTIKLWD